MALLYYLFLEWFEERVLLDDVLGMCASMDGVFVYWYVDHVLKIVLWDDLIELCVVLEKILELLSFFIGVVDLLFTRLAEDFHLDLVFETRKKGREFLGFLYEKLEEAAFSHLSGDIFEDFAVIFMVDLHLLTPDGHRRLPESERWSIGWRKVHIFIESRIQLKQKSEFLIQVNDQIPVDIGP